MPLGGGRGVSPPWMLTKIKEQSCCSIRELRSLNMVQKSAGSISSPHLFLSRWLYSFVFPQASCWIALAVLQERVQTDHFCGTGKCRCRRGEPCSGLLPVQSQRQNLVTRKTKRKHRPSACFGTRGGGGENHQQAYLSFYVGTWKLPAQHAMCQIHHFVCQQPLFPLLSPVWTKGWKIAVLLRQNYCWGAREGGREGWKATLVEKRSPRWNTGRLSSD